MGFLNRGLSTQNISTRSLVPCFVIGSGSNCLSSMIVKLLIINGFGSTSDNIHYTSY